MRYRTFSIKIFLMSFFMFYLAFPSYACAVTDNDVTSLFCEKMGHESLYDKYHFESYKMLVPGDDGWIYRTQSDLRQDFSLDQDARKSLQKLGIALAGNKVRLVILLTPTRAMMHPAHIRAEDVQENNYSVDRAWESYRRTADDMRSLGIDVVTLDRPEKEEPFFYKRDHHWNPQGAQKAAQALAAYIKELPEYDTITRTEFVTKTGDEEYDFEGVSKKIFRKLCQTEQPSETIKLSYTEPVESTLASNDLFGETVIPDIVLAGTSNSTQIPSYANFEGFLKEALSADLVNTSVSGGGLETGMLSYLQSDFYREHPAKILIWEIPAYYDISMHKQFFREAIPLAYGSCRDSAIASAERLKITDNSQLIFSGLGKHKITGSDYYVYAKFDEPVFNPFKFDMRYRGNRDSHRFKPANRDAARGPYVVVLSDEKKELLDKLVMWSPNENLGAVADIYICPANTKNGLPGEQNGVLNVRGLLQKFKSTIHGKE